MIGLSGFDVARKLTILARQFEIPLSLEEVSANPLLPSELSAQFNRDWNKYDSYFEHLIVNAKRQGQVLRYVATLNSQGQANVQLKAFPATHAFANLNPADNVVQFKTSRYRDNPLIVQEPGAGLEVTAAGLYADLLKMSRSLLGWLGKIMPIAP